MLTELVEYGHKTEEEMKAFWSEIKKTTQNQHWRKGNRDSNQRFGTKQEIHLQPEQNEETRIQKNEERRRNLWDNFKCSSTRIIGVTEEEEEQEMETYLNK